MFKIAATTGDPTSIGPEVADRALSSFLLKHQDCEVHLFGPTREGSPLLEHPRVFPSTSSPGLNFRAGKPSKRSAAFALENLEAAGTYCLNGEAGALVTGPVDKSYCAKIKKSFTGQTGFLRKLSKSKSATMLLQGESFGVALVTEHLPLKKVAKAITKAKIIETTKNLIFYKQLFIERPKIAICALNPHASDGGLLGSEEKELINPAIRSLKKRYDVEGPFPADTLFHRADAFDGIVAMYHDQGLIPLKMKHFYDAVNITLGLPFLRVSVDHGTAFDIAGKNKASALSYERALEHAYRWIKTKAANKSPDYSNSGSMRAQS